MPAAERLLRLYPRAWRNRYGDEFLALAGQSALGPRQTFDIVCGAIDAWLSADVRRAATGGHDVTNEGVHMLKSLLACERPARRITVVDGLLGAAVMLGATFLLTRLGHLATGGGWATTGHVLAQFSFLLALMVSFPVWLTKGQPWKAQAAIIGTTIAFILMLGYL